MELNEPIPPFKQKQKAIFLLILFNFLEISLTNEKREKRRVTVHTRAKSTLNLLLREIAMFILNHFQACDQKRKCICTCK